ncbi:MAG: NusG domain II-containing protein [Clostridia bacterium]|nr:NusG domain II-containing protein [Clostridia bacterium]
MKKGDIIICGAVCLLAAALAAVFMLFKTGGETVVVKRDNKVIAEYPLDTDTVVALGSNEFTVSGGEVYMSRADCKNQVCVHSGKISKRGECIVCLPNGIILEIQ